MATDYSLEGGVLAAGKPREWSDKALAFMGSGNYPYALAPDGKRFAVVLPPARSEQPRQEVTDRVEVLLNFSEELARKVPTGK
jgi:hypothetical protein